MCVDDDDDSGGGGGGVGGGGGGGVGGGGYNSPLHAPFLSAQRQARAVDGRERRRDHR